eukprot:scaffold3111_cov332-Prasinococcus_capsulatus_cf.AAC.2
MDLGTIKVRAPRAVAPAAAGPSLSRPRACCRTCSARCIALANWYRGVMGAAARGRTEQAGPGAVQASAGGVRRLPPVLRQRHVLQRRGDRRAPHGRAPRQDA